MVGLLHREVILFAELLGVGDAGQWHGGEDVRDRTGTQDADLVDLAEGLEERVGRATPDVGAL